MQKKHASTGGSAVHINTFQTTMRPVLSKSSTENSQNTREQLRRLSEHISKPRICISTPTSRCSSPLMIRSVLQPRSTEEETPASRSPTGANSSNACMCLDAFVPPLTRAKQLAGGDVQQWRLTATPAFVLPIRHELEIDDTKCFQFVGIH